MIYRIYIIKKKCLTALAYINKMYYFCIRFREQSRSKYARLFHICEFFIFRVIHDFTSEIRCKDTTKILNIQIFMEKKVHSHSYTFPIGLQTGSLIRSYAEQSHQPVLAFLGSSEWFYTFLFIPSFEMARVRLCDVCVVLRKTKFENNLIIQYNS